MKRKLKKILLVSLALLALIALGGYLFLRGGRPYSTDLNNLRAQFNQDKGKVRLLLVLSPT
jgi:flagellar basal body-associated protein FliL